MPLLPPSTARRLTQIYLSFFQATSGAGKPIPLLLCLAVIVAVVIAILTPALAMYDDQPELQAEGLMAVPLWTRTVACPMAMASAPRRAAPLCPR